MEVTGEMVSALVRKRYDRAKRPPEWANPVIQINAYEHIWSTVLLTPTQEGRLMRHLCYAALAGDVKEVLSWPFVDGIKRGPVGGERPRLPIALRLAVLERDNYTCKHCGSNDDLQIDHVLPWVHGGKHEIKNLQVLCGPCNRKKGPRPYIVRVAG